MLKYAAAAAAAVAIAYAVFGADREPPVVWDRPNPTATFSTTLGDFEAELFMDRVPRTVSNFVDLATSGFYNGIHFHRVIDDFMVQFGCPHARDPKSKKAGSGGPPDGAFHNYARNATDARFNGGNIRDEFTSRDTNAAGTLSMANSGARHSGGSQFFVNVEDNGELDWFGGGPASHPVFGRVTSGYDVVLKIARAKTDRDDRPVEPVAMRSIAVAGLA
jgi:cyclophilin family peptidyl-prolyl cis-trans isomerase